ncbi:OmpA family protein [Paraglaciecola sp. 20A4]|uniref:OmpA/MotB family protein n=1 Tax=Paraglaciecola sp. 20A4 TaxID=2687288 RepID=UPI00140BD544|nr:OmpA family protein [Paraglaciecola sp. 20A4]
MSEHNLLEDEGAGYLISVSDMMSGLLFIFIITLVAFIINFQDAIQKQKEITQTQKEIVKRFTNTDQSRSELLLLLKQKLEDQNIVVEIDAEHGVLRLTENAIQFETARASLDEKNESNLKVIGRVLDAIIPCYASNPPTFHNCEGFEHFQGKIDSIFIEGHTDNVPMKSYKYEDNWDLSAARAITAYRTLVPDTVLNQIVNTNLQPIISVSGYGEGRPVEGHSYSYPQSDPTNRRIDLRFIMTPPSLTDVQQSISSEAGR